MAAGCLFASAALLALTRQLHFVWNNLRRGRSSFYHRLARDAPGLNSVLEVIDGADSAHDARSAVETQPLPQVINTLDSGAMRAENLGDLKFVQFVRCPIELFVRSREQVKTTNGCLNRGRPEEFSGIVQRIDDAGVSAP